LKSIDFILGLKRFNVPKSVSVGLRWYILGW